MLRAVTLLMLGGALVACEAEVKEPAAAGSPVALSAKQDGRIAFDLPFARGEVKLPAEMMRNSNFNIDGVTMIPSGTITGFDLNAADEGSPKINLRFTAPVGPQEVQNYFVEQFRAQGVAASLADEALTGRTKDGTAFTMRFSPQGSGTVGTIQLNPARSRS